MALQELACRNTLAAWALQLKELQGAFAAGDGDAIIACGEHGARLALGSDGPTAPELDGLAAQA
jgi:hypothetical protein